MPLASRAQGWTRAAPALRGVHDCTASSQRRGRGDASSHLAEIENSAAPPVGAARGIGPELWPGKGAEAGSAAGRRAGETGSPVSVNCRFSLPGFSSPLFFFPSPLSPDEKPQQCFVGCAVDFRLLISVNQLGITDAGQHQPICLIKSQRSLFLLRSQFFPRAGTLL